MRESTTSPIVASYGPRRVQWLVVGGCSVLALVFLGMGFRSGAIIPLAFALLCSFSPEIFFLPEAGAIERHWKLLGILPLWRSRLRVSDFRSVFVGWYEGPQPEWRIWQVGLQRDTGRKLFLSFFNVRPGADCPPAIDLAQRLADGIGLPLHHEETGR